MKDKIKIRFNLLKYWLFNNNYNISFQEVMNFLFHKPYSSLAKAKIKHMIKMNNSYLKIKFVGFNDWFYFPAEMDINYLYQVIVELMYPQNWHYYEIEETTVTHDDIVVDCGAGEGLFGFLVGKKCRKLYVIEPLTRFNESMRLSFSTFNNVEIIKCALSSTNESIYLVELGINSFLTNEKIGVPVKIRKLDSIFFEKDIPVSYIKCDLEGYDFEMIKGAKETIRYNLPKIAITTYHNVNHVEQIGQYLKSINSLYKFKIKGIHPNSGAPIMLHAWC